MDKVEKRRRCDDCGEVKDKSELVQLDNLFYCKDCLEKEEKK